VVEGNAGPHGTKDIAEAYLRFLYTPAAQAIIAKHHFRPASPEYASEADRAQFPKLELVTIDGQFGGWARAQSQHFADGGTFDQLYGKK
jgi:ABC-type sulfate transport system substrate-binding protein